jgi:hypothetical protein
MLLNVDDFPLMCIGVLIYARTQSSPILTAADPNVAILVTAALNDRYSPENKPHYEHHHPCAVVVDCGGNVSHIPLGKQT